MTALLAAAMVLSTAYTPRYEFPEIGDIPGVIEDGIILGHLDTSHTITIARPPKPQLAAAASALFPGGGFFYLHEPGRASAYLAIEALELGAVGATVATSGYDPDDAATEERLARALLPWMWFQNTHLVGVYDAYRAARLRNPPENFRTPVPQPGVAGLLRAPLRGKQLLRPEIGVPLGVVAAAGLTFSLLYEGEDPTFWEVQRPVVFSREVPRWQAAVTGEAYWIGTFYPVGIGEEAFFRGVVQTSFEEMWGPRWGWIAASVLFGSLHALNAPQTWQSAAASATVTGAIGAYLGWLYQRDGYDLSAGAFFHVWYDVLIGTTLFLADPENQPFSASIAIPF